MINYFNKLKLILVLSLVGCEQMTLEDQNKVVEEIMDDSESNADSDQSPTTTYSYLALGDSYTIGTSVSLEDNYPNQLVSRFKDSLNIAIENQIIAQNGWTTGDLLFGINEVSDQNTFDLVTLLIGVNNQYRGLNFSRYEEEFQMLVNKSVAFAQGEKARVIVISIPDYAYTPFGQSSSNPEEISMEIDQYNGFAQQYCTDNQIKFVNVTDITRRGLNEPDLVATDNLHPSRRAYEKFVNILVPEVLASLDQD